MDCLDCYQKLIFVYISLNLYKIIYYKKIKCNYNYELNDIKDFINCVFNN